MSEGPAQGPNVAARVWFQPAALQMQGTELTTENPPVHYRLLPYPTKTCTLECMHVNIYYSTRTLDT